MVRHCGPNTLDTLPYPAPGLMPLVPPHIMSQGRSTACLLGLGCPWSSPGCPGKVGLGAGGEACCPGLGNSGLGALILLLSLGESHSLTSHTTRGVSRNPLLAVRPCWGLYAVLQLTSLLIDGDW
jgi:hypothetical protein